MGGIFIFLILLTIFIGRVIFTNSKNYTRKLLSGGHVNYELQNKFMMEYDNCAFKEQLLKEAGIDSSLFNYYVSKQDTRNTRAKLGLNQTFKSYNKMLNWNGRAALYAAFKLAELGYIYEGEYSEFIYSIFKEIDFKNCGLDGLRITGARKNKNTSTIDRSLYTWLGYGRDENGDFIVVEEPEEKMNIFDKKTSADELLRTDISLANEIIDEEIKQYITLYSKPTEQITWNNSREMEVAQRFGVRINTDRFKDFKDKIKYDKMCNEFVTKHDNPKKIKMVKKYTDKLEETFNEAARRFNERYSSPKSIQEAWEQRQEKLHILDEVMIEECELGNYETNVIFRHYGKKILKDLPSKGIRGVYGDVTMPSNPKVDAIYLPNKKIIYYEHFTQLIEGIIVVSRMAGRYFAEQAGCNTAFNAEKYGFEYLMSLILEGEERRVCERLFKWCYILDEKWGDEFERYIDEATAKFRTYEYVFKDEVINL